MQVNQELKMYNVLMRQLEGSETILFPYQYMDDFFLLPRMC